MGAQGEAGSSAEHANAPAVRAEVPEATAVMAGPIQRKKRTAFNWCVLVD